MVDTNLAKSKLDINRKQRLILPNVNAKIADCLNQLIGDMEEMNGLICRWDENCFLIDARGTQFRFWNPITEVQYILRHPLIQDDLLYMPV